MGARIESVGSSTAGLVVRHGALALADAAARRCLEQADRAASEVDLLVNCGIYREKNLAEPALASMIQEDIGANPGHPPGPDHHGTFSFDIANGGCGVVTAAQLVDGFLRAHTIDLGLVVASDSDPGDSERYPFAPTGGAMLLAPGPQDRGFVAFRTDTYGEHEGAFEARVTWDERQRHMPFTADGHNVLHVRERDDFAELAVRCAARTARGLLEEQSLGSNDVDLLVTSQYPVAFPVAIAGALEIPRDRVATPPEGFEAAHTAGPLGALAAAVEGGRLSEGCTMLMVTVGAGITAACALYRG